VTVRGVDATLPWVVALIATCLAALQTARLLLRPWKTRRRLASQGARARAGEERAAGMLTRRGYDVVGTQVSTTYAVRVDGELREVLVRADYLVARGQRLLVAEVKTGTAAPRIETSATRRQLLEYRIAFDVDGVLLVEPDADTVHEVAFGFPAPTPGRGRAWLALAAFALGVALGALLLR